MTEDSRSERFKRKWHQIIFEADTPAGKAFDVILLVVILLSVVVVMLESMSGIRAKYAYIFNFLEWTFTIFFTIEYILRIYLVKYPSKYIFSFYGIIDLLATLPAYLSLFFAGTHYFIVIRIMRLLRVFRIFKLGHYLRAGHQISTALKNSADKIFVFLSFVVMLVTVIGSLMHIIEGGQNEGFSSIPKSIYWAIVTLTTVGYGDITPQTNLGQFFSAIVMIIGYAIIAVPTGIVTGEIMKETKNIKHNTQVCRQCGLDDHADDAIYCKNCGFTLNE